jgi:hypothetical protein
MLLASRLGTVWPRWRRRRTAKVAASFAGACRSCTLRDSMLQPIFDRAIGTNWEPHLERIVNFWCSVVLTSGDFKGNYSTSTCSFKDSRWIIPGAG